MGRNNVCTLLFSCNLTGHTWNVTVEASPSSLTLAGIRGSLLPACASIFTGGWITPAHKILTGKQKKIAFMETKHKINTELYMINLAKQYFSLPDNWLLCSHEDRCTCRSHNCPHNCLHWDMVWSHTHWYHIDNSCRWIQADTGRWRHWFHPHRYHHWSKS